MQELALRLRREEQPRVAAAREKQLQLEIQRLQKQDLARAQLLQETRSLLTCLQQQHTQIRSTALDFVRQVQLKKLSRKREEHAEAGLDRGEDVPSTVLVAAPTTTDCVDCRVAETRTQQDRLA